MGELKSGDKVTYEDCFGDKELVFIGQCDELEYNNDCVLLHNKDAVPARLSGVKKIILDALNASVVEVVDFDITKHRYECGRILNDSMPGDENINLCTMYNTAYISKNDAIAIAKHFKLTREDLK